ncbi:TIGR03086 family metal-binding protein [Actinomycetospora sp. TBRC 11914]|uniref:TIGR03086 family metal-binding protein n=1 Tax=Actinomycetospora sp. TBRC 11914 TaxID=2729387 RepID=UPI00145F61A2|nr:TIGR03086 family metal-binding protein [Actinomycetospora sp. TBRC 11914]NMO94108.1 TIGR03086 family protein [Actinomycetospora sp. TBRC 11914]
MTDDVRDLVPAAVDRFGERVHAVPAYRWPAPTPCAGWSVRDLVAHLCFEHRWAPHVLAGETMAAVGDRYDGDLVGGDPVRAWDGAAVRSRAAFAVTGSHAARVHVSFGWLDVEEYAVQMLVDLTVHEWDLARGAGLDEHLDPACVAATLAYLRTDPVMLDGPGLFAAPVAAAEADPQARLLALTGRRTGR